MFRQLYSTLKSSKNIFLVSHPNCPDAAGSLVSLIYVLNKLNKKYFAYLDEPILKYLKFMPENSQIKNRLPNLNHFETFIITDCSDLKHTRIANKLEYIFNQKQSKIFNLDHHLSNNYFGKFNIVNPDASSTCELMYEFLTTSRITIPKSIAETLLAGILSDTDFFQNAATTNKAVLISKKLIGLGANLFKLNKLIFNNQEDTNDLLRLKGLIFSRLLLNQTYNIASTYILQKDLEKYKIKNHELEGIANFLNNLKDVTIAFILKETEKGSLKISMRTTQDNIDLSQLARFFDGGGHKKAAGFTLNHKSKINSDP